MSSDSKVRDAIEDLVRVETELTKILDAFSGREREPLAPGAWSPAEHVLHVVLGLEETAGAFEGRRERPSGPLPDVALATVWARRIVLATWRIPSGVAAPPTLVPNVILPRAALALRLREARDALGHLAPEFAPLVRRRAWVPHPFLGPLSFREWTRFHLIHTRHHRAAVRRAARQTQGPP